MSVPYSKTVDRDTDIEIYPTPITDDDITDIGGEIETSDQWKAEYYLATDLEAHYWCVHKATIPMSAMRQLIDQDDQYQMVTFRCSIVA